MMLTQDAETAVQVITALGGRALLVGGFVRDQFLGIESSDIDIEVHGPVDPDTLIAALQAHGRVDLVGISFGVIKFGRDVDISFARRDSKTGVGHTGFSIEFDTTITVEEALARRDFTINSIAVDAVTGEIIDPFGGRADIEAKIIRHTSSVAFADDPLRVMRAVQFASRFDFSIAPETAKLCNEIRGNFTELAIERVWCEWFKILTKGKSMQAVWEALVDTGWDMWFPEWLQARYVDRVLSTIDTSQLSGARRASIILGSMFACRRPELDRFLRSIDAPSWLHHDSRLLVRLYPNSTGEDPAATVRIIARKLGSVRLADWLVCHWLHGSLLRSAAADQGVLFEARPRLLTGDMLIEFGLTPGPEFGTILAAALETQDIEGWETKEEALTWLRTTSTASK